jgi:uncharacterized membrane protein YcaP (DUF421 family)
MTDMDLPWWEFVVRAAVIYLFLLVMVRVSGKRTVGQFTPFDLLVVMLLSEGVSNSLSGGDTSLFGGLLVAATLIAINLTVAFATARSQKIQELVEGRPVLIGRDGEVFHERLQEQHVSISDFNQALREADCELVNMRCAFLEIDGKITIQQKS